MIIAQVPIIAQAGTEEISLTTAGAAIMTLSILLVMGLLVFCMYRILHSSAPAERKSASQEMETADDLSD